MRFSFSCNHATCLCRTGSDRDERGAAAASEEEDVAPCDEDAMAEEPDEFDSSDGMTEQWPSGCDPAWLSDAAPPFETEGAATFEADGDEWLEVGMAADEVVRLREPASAPRSPDRHLVIDPYRWQHHAPSPVRPCAGFSSAREVARRRWARLSARPANLSDLPVELHACVLSHVQGIDTVARLSLCSRSWHALAAEAATEPRFWLRIERLRASGMTPGQLRRSNTIDYTGATSPGQVQHSQKLEDVTRDCLRLLGALASLSSGPPAVVALVRSVLAAARAATAVRPRCWSANYFFVWNHGHDEFGRAVAKCRRTPPWEADDVASLLWSSTVELHDPDTSAKVDGFNLAFEAQLLHQGLNCGVAHEDFLAAFLRMATPALTSEQRCQFVMESFGIFLHDYEFDEAIAARIGSFAAASGMAVGHVAELVERCAQEEARDEDEGDAQTLDLAASVTVLRTWAADSRFPQASPPADIAAFLEALGAWDERLRRGVTPLCLEWLRDALDPQAEGLAHHHHALGLIDALIG